MYFEVFKFIVIFAGYELNPLKQVKYKTIYKMRKVSLALLLAFSASPEWHKDKRHLI